MPSPNDTQAIAARLTAIADFLAAYDSLLPSEKMSKGSAAAIAVGLLRDLSAHVETLTQQVAELADQLRMQKDRNKGLESRIRKELEPHLHDALGRERTLKQENARLTAEMRKIEGVLQAGIPDCIVGNFPKQTAQFAVAAFQQAEQENARLTAECKRLDNAVAEVWDNVHRVVQQAWVKPHDYDDSPLDLIAAVIDERDEAEQQRDTAHAALNGLTVIDTVHHANPSCACFFCNRNRAALAASAPQKETPLEDCTNPDCPIGCPDSHAVGER